MKMLYNYTIIKILYAEKDTTRIEKYYTYVKRLHSTQMMILCIIVVILTPFNGFLIFSICGFISWIYKLQQESSLLTF